MMFEHIIEENNLKENFLEHNLKNQDIIFIKELIAGPLKRSTDNTEVRIKRSYALKMQQTLWILFHALHLSVNSIYYIYILLILTNLYIFIHINTILSFYIIKTTMHRPDGQYMDKPRLRTLYII